MSHETNKTVAQQWHELVFNQHNLAAIDSLLDEHYVNHTAHMHGRDAARAQFTDLIHATPDVHIIIEDMIAEGDKVVTRWTWLEGGRATAIGITIHRIANGKIVEDWFCSQNQSAS